jgi:hypothetical protein
MGIIIDQVGQSPCVKIPMNNDRKFCIGINNFLVYQNGWIRGFAYSEIGLFDVATIILVGSINPYMKYVRND